MTSSVFMSLNFLFAHDIRLRALAAEVTRVTLEVGSQGKLGGQAHVPDVEGVWLNLVRNVLFILIYCVGHHTELLHSGQSDVFFFDGSSTVHRACYDCRRSRRFDTEN